MNEKVPPRARELRPPQPHARRLRIGVTQPAGLGSPLRATIRALQSWALIIISVCSSTMDQLPSKSTRRAGAEFWNGRIPRGETYNPDGLIITAAHHGLPLGHALAC